VIGDAADLEENGAPLPQLAPVAQQQARRAAANIAAHLKGEPMRPFRYFDKGTMATIGRNAAVAQVGRIRVKGFLGWLGWLFLHLLLIVSLRSRLIVFINWTWDYFFKDRPVRLILTARSITHDDRDAVGS
jgi:NADH dehydrogenase